MNVSASGRRVNFLRLVEPETEPKPVHKATFARQGWQNTLFADEHTSLLVVLEFDRLPASDFLALIAVGNPKLVIDLRRVPRFDISHLNRRLVLELFAEKQVVYRDLSGRISEAPTGRREISPSQIATMIFSERNLTGPIVLLVDKPEAEEKYLEELVGSMPAAPAGVWDVLRLPLSNPIDARRRNLIFVSHANPEDNSFAAWLCGKLAIAGYQAWSDVTKLVGGELFWNDIEEAIRYHAAKCIVVLSRLSQTKDGVLDEIDLAVRVERTQSIGNFVVPIRIDDLPFTDVRANLSRKNIIDFGESWAKGLTALLEVLARDGVPRTLSTGAAALTESLGGGLRARAQIGWKPETLVSNWLPVRQMPASIDMIDTDGPADAVKLITSNFGWPAFSYLRLVGIFGDAGRDQQFAIQGYTARIKYRIPVERFLAGRPNDLPGLARNDARRLVANLARQAWDRLMTMRKLRSFETASGALAWYLPQGMLEGDRIIFVDDGGVIRRKKLVGWSDRRQVFWHAAFDAQVALTGLNHVLLRQHVIFTEDGVNPIGNHARMHSLRRTFCKSWWNDRWRDLFLGFTAFLSDQASIRLPVGPTGAIVLDAPLRMVSPVDSEVSEHFIDDEAEAADFLDGPEDDVEDLPEDDFNVERPGAADE